MEIRNKIEKPTPAEKSAVNSASLENLLDVLEDVAPDLEHITLFR